MHKPFIDYIHYFFLVVLHLCKWYDLIAPHSVGRSLSRQNKAAGKAKQARGKTGKLRLPWEQISCEPCRQSRQLHIAAIDSD